jgi:DNA-binding GntR family transcriptional regulator
MKKKPAEGKNLVERAYQELREMAIAFEIRPGERLNEIALAKHVGVSRTPLREALNRLCSEGFLTFSKNLGFFRKSLEVKEIFDLYEFRQKLEVAGVRLAVVRARADQLAEIDRFLERSAKIVPTRTTLEMVALDEEFHEQVMSLSENAEMLHSLKNINSRIRYVRWVDMDGRRTTTQGQHAAILKKLGDRDAKGAAQLMSDHIGQRLENVIENVEKCYGKIYVSGQQNGRNGRVPADSPVLRFPHSASR